MHTNETSKLSESKEKTKLVSLNIERDKHLDRVLEFLKEENADVVCLQEVIENDVETIKKAIGISNSIFNPQLKCLDKNGNIVTLGTIILSKSPIIKSEALLYSEEMPMSFTPELFQNHLPQEERKVLVNKQGSRKLLVAEIAGKDKNWKIATVHFTWCFYGSKDKNGDFIWDINQEMLKEQTEDATRLIKILNNLKEFVFCGDLNSPRGEKVFGMFEEKFKDNIPKQYETSIDESLHRVGHLPLMVDVLFTTPNYQAKNVVFKNGISDHLALVCEIQ